MPAEGLSPQGLLKHGQDRVDHYFFYSTMQQEEGADQISEQHAKVVKYIIKNTPFGQANQVVKDLCKLLPKLEPNSDLVCEALKEHNEEHLAVFKGQDFSIIASVLNANGNIYVDQKRGLTMTVDHERLTVISSDKVELPANESLNNFRDVLDTELNNYLSKNYNEKISGAYVMYMGDEQEFTFYIGLTAKNINLPNFYCGDWISTWEFTKQDLTGEVKCQAHYYEEGNVQLKNSAKFNEQINIDLSKEAAKDVIARIARWENQHQASLFRIYDNMPDIFFKAMRRVLPVTGTKLNWKDNVYKMVKQ